MTRHPSGPDLGGSPLLISKIEVDATALFGDADMHCPIGRVEEGAGFEQIESGAKRRQAESASGCL